MAQRKTQRMRVRLPGLLYSGITAHSYIRCNDRSICFICIRYSALITTSYCSDVREMGRFRVGPGRLSFREDTAEESHPNLLALVDRVCVPDRPRYCHQHSVRVMFMEVHKPEVYRHGWSGADLRLRHDGVRSEPRLCKLRIHELKAEYLSWPCITVRTSYCNTRHTGF